MNQPYVKEYDKKTGKLLNPIVGAYEHSFPNRRQRKSEAKKDRFKGNQKGNSLTVLQGFKYHRVRQRILLEDRSIKTINHYVIGK